MRFSTVSSEGEAILVIDLDNDHQFVPAFERCVCRSSLVYGSSPVKFGFCVVFSSQMSSFLSDSALAKQERPVQLPK